MITVVANKAQFEERINSNELVVIKFTASWCQPCKTIQPQFEAAAERVKQVAFVEVDTDAHKDIAQSYQVTAMPTFVFLHKKSEIGRVKGANMTEVVKNLEALVAKNPDAERVGDKPVVTDPQLSSYIPKGYDLMNDLVYTPDAEVLNADKPQNVKQLLSLEATGEGIQSDADSQLLVYMPLNNRVKTQSILIKAATTEKTQLPNKIKVWANTTGMISFDDASDGVKALHQSDLKFDDNGYAKVELRYVLFQNVASLLVFLDGEDEDEPTKLDQIVLIGNRGEARDPGKLSKIDDE